MKTSHIIILVLVILAIPVAWYLLSPIFIVVEADEASPLAEPTQDTIFDDPLMQAAFDEVMEESSKQVTVMNDVMPSGPQLVAQGLFKPSSHEVAGTALLIEQDNKQILRFEDFETINGPELHIYLATDSSADDYVDLGIIKATKGNVNYDVPASIDTEKYDTVLVWCEPFSVLFSYAELA